MNQSGNDDQTLFDRAGRVATELLLHELEAIASRLDELPDEVIGGPAMRMIRAITATDMRPGIAARMTIGRRWLAHDGIDRLLGAHASPRDFATTTLAELLLALLDGPTPLSGRIEGLERALDALLARQRDDGTFAAQDGEPGSLRVAELACRALAAIRRHLGGAPNARIDHALARAATALLRAQRVDGAFASSPDTLGDTSWAMEALSATEPKVAQAPLERAATWLVAQRRADGAFGPATAAPEDGAETELATARVLRALVLSGAGTTPAASDAATFLALTFVRAAADERDAAPTFAARPLAAHAAGTWEAHAESLEALGLFAHRATACRALAASPASPEPARATPIALGDADWIFCRERLVEVSRSFSRPIALLPRHLEVAVTLAYLLCRIADTIEDHPAVPSSSREALFACFLDVLRGGCEPEALAAAFDEVPGIDADLSLARGVSVAMRVLRAQPAATQASSVRWIAELARGMALYSYREPESDGLVALTTVADLERYCYFVAGTVGHFLTDLFLDEIGDDATPELATTLRVLAEPFATGLQLVNILKDLVADQERGFSYVPRTSCGLHGLGPRDLASPSHRVAAHAAVAPLFDLARRSLDDGFRYALAIPPRHDGIRRFCLLPLWMAARTLVAARGSDTLFTPGSPVKIPRAEVEALAIACVTYAADDAELEARYAALWVEAPHEDERRSAG